MSATGRPADRSAHPTFDDVDVVAACSENPARWLNRDLSAGSNRAWIQSLIDGIVSHRRLTAWRVVEYRLGRGPDDGARPAVVRALDSREAALEATDDDTGGDGDGDGDGDGGGGGR